MMDLNNLSTLSDKLWRSKLLTFTFQLSSFSFDRSLLWAATESIDTKRHIILNRVLCFSHNFNWHQFLHRDACDAVGSEFSACYQRSLTFISERLTAFLAFESCFVITSMRCFVQRKSSWETRMEESVALPPRKSTVLIPSTHRIHLISH